MADDGSIVGGLMGLKDPDLLLNVGLGLMSAAKYGGNVGDGLAGALHNYQQQKLARQQLGMNQLQMQRMQAQLPIIQAAAGAIGGGMPQPGQAGPAPMQGAPQASAAPQPVANFAPQAAPPQQAQPPQGGLMGGGGAGDPFATMRLGALMDLGGLGGQGVMELGKAQLANNPALQTQMAAAKDQITQDQYLIQQARAQGNAQLAQGLQIKLLNDLGMVKVASQSGNVTTMGGLSPQQLGVNTVSPREGVQMVNGQESPIPGAINTRSALAAAQAIGGAAGQVEPVQDKSGNTSYVPRT